MDPSDLQCQLRRVQHNVRTGDGRDLDRPDQVSLLFPTRPMRRTLVADERQHALRRADLVIMGHGTARATMALGATGSRGKR